MHCMDYSTDVRTPDEMPFLLLLSNSNDQSRSLTFSDLPHYPYCTNLLRLGVVWFGGKLAAGAPDSIDEWMSEEHVDLVIAAGTSLEVIQQQNG
jgi:NAD+-dependent protein deacetylase sirtuin 5